MEQTISTLWYVKKCAWGALVCCVAEFALLALTAVLVLNGTLGEERIGAAALTASALAALTGCVVASRRTSKRLPVPLACAASAWLTVQLLGFLVGGGLEPGRALMTAAAMLAGAAVSLLCGKGQRKRKRSGARARRGRR